MHARFNSLHDKSSSEFKLTVVYFSNITESLVLSFIARIQLTTSPALPRASSCIWIFSKFMCLHSLFTNLHFRKQWPPSSSRRQHTGHLVSMSIPLLIIFRCKGKLSWPNLHKNISTFGGQFNFHNFLPLNPMFPSRGRLGTYKKRARANVQKGDEGGVFAEGEEEIVGQCG